MTSAKRAASTLARNLGWFSIGLGVLELSRSSDVGRAAGLEGHERLLRALGMREVVTGIGLLTSSRPALWMWARTAGDLMDLAVLAGSPGPGTSRRAAALIAVGAITAVDVCCAAALTREDRLPPVSYSDRSGFPRAVAQMRGAARADFNAPSDMRIPRALRPFDASESFPAPPREATP
jgi:hypothetical protein